MTGSLKWFIYEANDSKRYSFLIDESKAKGVVSSNYASSGRQLFPAIAAPYPGKAPKGFVMRSVQTVGFFNKRARRKFWVGSRSVFEELLTGEKFISADGELWGVISGKEEKLPRPFLDIYFDTGLDDGTNIS